MNRIYRLVFNHALGQIQVTSEIGTSPGATTGTPHCLPARLRPRLLPLVLALACAAGAQAAELPQNWSANGATVSSVGNTMTITQAQAKALITWGSFNIGEGGAVNIAAPDPGSVTLNVVSGGPLSSIDGVLTSNGHVFLINPAGIAFGGNAQVNVAGLVASSLALTADDQGDNYEFAQSGTAAGVSNVGYINSSGPVVLMGASVSNNGVIDGRTVNLLSAGGVSLHYDPERGATAVVGAVTSSLPGGTSAAVSNTGSIMADRIVLQANLDPALAASAINLGGAVQATQLLSADVVGGGVHLSGDVSAENIRLSGDKGVSQTAGKLVATTGLDLALTGDATLSSATNEVARIGGVVSGNLALSNTVDLAQTGALEVAGTTTLSNPSNNIELTNAGNRFGGNVALTGVNVAISAAGSLALGNADVGSLDATAESIHLPAEISSDGMQKYNGAVVLGKDTLLASSLGTIRFDGVIDGAHALSVKAGGDVVFGGAVGGSTALTSLDVSSVLGISLPSNVTTTGMQRYGGPVNLSATTSLTSRLAGAIDFNYAINGAHGLTVNTAGATTFTGAIGATTALASLTTDAAGTTQLRGNVRTTGSQTYGDTVSLGGPVTLSSAAAGNITFGSSVTGTSGLIVNTAGQTAFAGAVNLGSLITDAGGSTRLGGDVTTSGAQAYGDGLVLTGDITLVSTLGNSIDINAGANGAHALAVNTAGTTTLAGGFGSTAALASFATGAGGTSRLAGVFNTLGDQVYGDNVVLFGGTTLSSSAGSIGFSGLLDGAYSLTTTAAGATHFGGAVGATNALASLAVSSGSFSAQGIRTAGDLSLDVSNGILQTGAYRVGGDASFASGGDLTLTNVGNIFTGKVALDGATVYINASTALDISRARATTLNAQALGALAIDDATIAGGGATLTGKAMSLGSITVTDGGGLGVDGSSISQFGALEVSGASAFKADGGNITLGALNAFGGRVDLEGLDVLINAGDLLRLGSVRARNLEASAAQLQFGNNITTTGYQRYAGALGLTRDTLLVAGGELNIAGSIDGGWGLALESDVAVRIAGDVGQSTALSSLTVSGAAAIDSAITTVGQQMFNGALQLNGDSNLTSLQGNVTLAAVDGAYALALNASNGTVRVGSVGASNALTSLQIDSAAVGLLGASVTTSGAQQYNASVVMTNDVALASTGGGDIGFGSSIDGGFALQVNTAGGTRFGGTVGGVTALASLTTDAAGTTELGGGITAIGGIAFNDAVNLRAFTNVRSLGGTTTFGSTVVGPWALVAAGNTGTAFGGAVDVGSLLVQGDGTTRLGGDVSADASAVFNRPVLLTNDVTVDAGAVFFAGAINGAHALDITAIGSVTIGDHVGANTALNSMTVRGASLSARGITTTGNLSVDVAADITQTAAYGVGGSASFASQGNITLGNSGNRFDGAVALDGGAIQIASASALDLDVVQAGSLHAVANGRVRLGNATIAGNATLNGSGIVFDDATIQGNLGAVSGGFIRQSGALSVSGSSQLNAAGDITLSNGQNVFGGALGLSGTTIDVESASDLLVTQLHNGANSAVSLVSGKGLSLTGNDVDTGTANLTLAANGGQLITQVALVGADLELLGSHGIALSGNVSAAGAGRFSSNNGDIVQNSGRTQVGGLTRISAGTGRIGFGNSNNLFTGPVHLSGGAATIRSTGLLVLDGPAVRSLDATGSAGLDVADMSVTGNAALDAGSGALTVNNVDVGGNLTASGGSITQTGSMAVDGAATLSSAGSILVSSAALGSLDATAGDDLSISNGAVVGDAVLRANDVLTMDALRVEGNMAASAGSIAQTGALFIAGTGDLRSGTRIVLDNTANEFAGPLSLQGQQVLIAAAGNLQLARVDATSLAAGATGMLSLGAASILGNTLLDGRGVNLGAATIGGDLQIKSGAGITQTAALRVGGSTDLMAVGAIALGNAGNDFRGGVSALGDGIVLADANDMELTALDNRNGDGAVTAVAGGTLTLPATAVDVGSATLTLLSQGGSLSISQALAGGDMVLGGRDGLALSANVSSAGMLALNSGAGITQSSGVLAAAALTGSALGDVKLRGENRLSSLGDFKADGFDLTNANSLLVDGNVTVNKGLLLHVESGDLQLSGQLNADAVRLQTTGDIVQSSTGSIVAKTLSGRSGGATRLGTPAGFAANRVGLLGDFVANGGFSMTNEGTLALGSVNGSQRSVDVGDAAFFLKIEGGDLLQVGKAAVRAGEAHWWSSGGIGTSLDPIYLVTSHPTTYVDFVGMPPAYFYAEDVNGTPLTITGSVNIPIVVLGSRAQSGSMRRMPYVDIGSMNAEYRAFGIVKPGIRLPADQLAVCDHDDPDAECAQ